MAYSWKDNVKLIWSILVGDLGEVATAGVMGNLRKEDPILYGFQKQGDLSQSRKPSINYTNNVTNGTISSSSFINDSIGYGLAQWTFWSYKEDLYNYWKEASTASSIGNTKMQAQFLLWHLKHKATSVYNNLLKADGVRDSTNIFLDQYENPRDPEATREERYQYAVEIYEYCQGTSPDPDPPEPEPPSPPSPTPTFNSRLNYIFWGKPYWKYPSIF